MMKQNKGKMILSSILILLPVLFGLAMWNRLPELMAIHWGMTGQEDGWVGRGLAVFALPLLLLVLFWLGIWWTFRDHRHREQDKKVFGLVFWICPLISLWVNGMIYATAFGLSFNMMIPVCILLGAVFLIMGNYMPKCRQNHTIGIKIKWTLANEENWNATHRFGGKVWFLCGLLVLASAFLPMAVFPWVMIALILLAVVPVFLYSYVYARRQIREGRAKKEDFKMKQSKPATIVGMIVAAVMIVGAMFLMFTGNVAVQYDETSFEAKADYYGYYRISYETIEEIEYRENFDFGSRIVGVESPRLSVGKFENKEFGDYMLYAYTGCDEAVIVRNKEGQVVVLNGKDTEATKQIFEELSQRVAKK